MGPLITGLVIGGLSLLGVSLAAPLTGDMLRGMLVALILTPLYFSAGVVHIAGLLFDYVVENFIIKMPGLISNITGINTAWAVIRDLVNISFIFILLFTAIKLIVGQSNSGQMKKIIVGVVMAAILVNFSLFFAKVIIDVSNTLTLTIHESIVTSCGEPEVDRVELSTCFVNPLGITTIFNPESDSNKEFFNQLKTNFSFALILSVFGSVFLLITAFVFLTIAIMFALRVVKIIYLLITSPIAVMGTLIPNLAPHTSKWWKDITDQAVFPPVFMLLSWVVLQVLSSPQFLLKGNLANVVAGVREADATTSGDLGLVANFIIIISLMIGVLTITRSFSQKAGAQGAKFAGALMGGGLGLVGRNTAGRLGRRIAESGRLKDAELKGGLSGAAARMALRGGQKSAKSSFDMRATKAGGYVGKDLLGGAGKAGGKGGFDKYVKDEVEAEKKYAESFNASGREKEAAERELREAEASQDETRIAKAKERLLRVKGRSTEDVKKRHDEIKLEETAALKDLDTEWEKAEEDLKKLSKDKEVKEAEVANAQIIQVKEAREQELREIEKGLKAAQENHETKKKEIEERKKSTRDKYKGERDSFKIVEDIGKVRQKAYAESLRSAPEISIDNAIGKFSIPLPSRKRAGYFGKVSRISLDSAAAIEKQAKGKSVAEEVFEKMKKEAEKEGKKDDDRGDDKDGGKKDGGKEGGKDSS